MRDFTLSPKLWKKILHLKFEQTFALSHKDGEKIARDKNGKKRGKEGGGRAEDRER